MAPPVELPEVQLTPYIVTESQEAEVAIDEAQVFLLERGNARGTAQERAAFARKLQADIRKIKSALACMKLAGANPDEMRQAVAAQILKLKESYGHFSTGTAQFIQAKSAVEQRMDAFEEKVRSTPPIPSAGEKTYAELFAESKSPLELLSDDEFWEKGFRASERDTQIEQMIDLRVAVALPQMAIEAACGVHPKVEKACKKVALVMQKGQEAVRDFLFTPEQQQTRQKNIEKDAQMKEARLGIPQGAVKQYHADMPDYVVGGVVGGGVVAGAAGISKLRHLIKRAPYSPFVKKGDIPDILHAANSNKKPAPSKPARVDLDVPDLPPPPPLLRRIMEKKDTLRLPHPANTDMKPIPTRIHALDLAKPRSSPLLRRSEVPSAVPHANSDKKRIISYIDWYEPVKKGKDFPSLPSHANQNVLQRPQPPKGTRQIDPPKLIKEAKPRADHLDVVKKERELREKIGFPPIKDFPAESPQHLVQFNTRAEVKEIHLTNLGKDGKGRLVARMLHVPFQNADGTHVLYVIRRNYGTGTPDKLANTGILASENLNSIERLNAILTSLFDHSKGAGHKRVFVAVQNEGILPPLFTVMRDRGEKIVGRGAFSKGLHEIPMTMIEVDLTGVRKPWDFEPLLVLSDELQKRDLNLVELGVMKTYTSAELQKKQLLVKDGLLYQGDFPETLHAIKMNFVMKKDGTILVDARKHADGESFHSSLVHGESPIAAGEIGFWGGKVKELTEKSGHYKPEGRLQYVEHELKSRGAQFAWDYNQ